MTNLDIRVVKHTIYSCRGKSEENYDIAVGDTFIEGLSVEQMKTVNDAIKTALYMDKNEEGDNHGRE